MVTRPDEDQPLAGNSRKFGPRRDHPVVVSVSVALHIVSEAAHQHRAGAGGRSVTMALRICWNGLRGIIASARKGQGAQEVG